MNRIQQTIESLLAEEGFTLFYCDGLNARDYIRVTLLGMGYIDEDENRMHPKDNETMIKVIKYEEKFWCTEIDYKKAADGEDLKEYSVRAITDETYNVTKNNWGDVNITEESKIKININKRSL